MHKKQTAHLYSTKAQKLGAKRMVYCDFLTFVLHSFNDRYDHVSVEYHAERFEMMTEFNRMGDNKELANMVVDEI